MTAAARRTLLALIASALGAVPLCQLFTDRGWLLEVWLAMAIAVAPAFLLRLRRPPGALQMWPGLLLLLGWLVLRFVHTGAVLGVVPTTRTWHAVQGLLADLHHTAAHEVAPVHTTVAIDLALCALLGLVAALVDLLAVVGRHGVLGGLPLLVVFTVAGAIPNHGVDWTWFVASAVAFLLLLTLDARDDVAGWGHRIARPAARTPRRVDLAAQRIGVIAIIAALLAPLVVPTAPSDFLTRLFRTPSGSGGSGNGFGVGGTIDPWVALQGQLLRPQTLMLATVDVGTGLAGQPFYLRTNVLSDFTGTGWREASHGPAESLSTTAFDTLPADPSPIISAGTARQLRFRATVHITGMRGNAPVFALPAHIDGLPNVVWSPQDQLLLGTPVSQGTTYSEDVAQPVPSAAELRATSLPAGGGYDQWLQLPPIPAEVRRLTDRIVGNGGTPYAIARAINDYFTDPANGFSYSLQTKQGDSGNDLVDFLRNKVGFCQQYAASMAVMLRLAGVPSRVVLGYSHPVPNSSGSFQVTTDDAHAWVEAYLGPIGWIPFDPTPLAGIVGGKDNDLPWAPHPSQSGVTASATASGPSAPHHSLRPSAQPSRSGAVAAPGGSSSSGYGGLIVLVVVLGLLAVGLVPWGVRLRRRRLRVRPGADAEALWAELRDTTVDLGYVWSPARSPRQVVRWLREPVGDGLPELRALAAAVERQRYGPAAAGDLDLRGQLATVSERLRSAGERADRWRATFLPQSLGWRLPKGRRRH